MRTVKQTGTTRHCSSLSQRVIYTRTFCLHLLLWLLFAGCLSPLDRFAEYNGGQIVISGQVSTITESNAVYVGRTSDRERLPEPVVAMDVTLFEDGNLVYNFTPDPSVQ